MTGGTAAALAQWRPSYKRATVMQASLAIAGALSAVGAAMNEPRKAGWLVGSVLLGSVVPFTLVVMLPTNTRLLDPTIEHDLEHLQKLLSQWNRLHAVRSVLGASAFLIFAVSLTPNRP